MSSEVKAVGHVNRFRRIESIEPDGIVTRHKEPKLEKAPEAEPEQPVAEDENKKRGVGAPKKFPNQETKHISFQVSKELHQSISKIAAAKSYKVVADYIRDLMEKDIREYYEQEQKNIAEMLSRLK